MPKECATIATICMGAKEELICVRTPIDSPMHEEFVTGATFQAMSSRTTALYKPPVRTLAKQRLQHNMNESHQR